MYFFGDILFETSIIKNIFQVVFSLFLVSEFLIFTLTTLNSIRSENKGKKSDKGSCFFMIAGFTLSILLNVFFRKCFDMKMSNCIFYIGAVISLLGIILRAVAVLTLRRAFTVSVQTSNKQRIIEKGPYSLIRHPAYTGSILTLFGISLCFRDIFGVITTLIIAVIIYGYRIRIEEKVLESVFGEEYKEYEKRTYKLIPYLI